MLDFTKPLAKKTPETAEPEPATDIGVEPAAPRPGRKTPVIGTSPGTRIRIISTANWKQNQTKGWG